MSTGKRLAKRSILGTRVVAPGDDGRLYPGIIADMKTPEGGSSSTANTSPNHIRYTVRFDENRKMKDFYEGEIIGPGFSAVTSSKLKPKQKVWVTNANREMEGYVLHHRPNIDQVIIQLNGGPEVKKKLEEVRLMESRKSARLIGQGTTDFSKLADFNIVHERKRLNSETSDISSGTTCGRKRRGSETLSDSSGDEYFGMNGIISSTNQISYWTQSPTSRQKLNCTPTLDSSIFQNGQFIHGTDGEGGRSGPVMSECTAALVLMNLSHSPANSNYISRNLNGDVTYSIKKEGSGLRSSSPSGSASVLPASTQLYLANLESNHIEDSQSKHKNQKLGHAGHVRCLPGGACLVGSEFISSSPSSSRLPEEQVQEPTDLSQTSVSSTNISSNLDLSRTITNANDTNVSQRSVETPTIISESSSSSESSFPPSSSLCASTPPTRKTAAASPTLSTMSSCSASIISNASNGATIILPQFGTTSNTNMERSVSPSSTSGASSMGNSWASTPTMVTVVPPSGASNNGSIHYINTSSNSNGQSSASASPASSLLTSSSVHLTEAEALLQLSNQESDEGIVSDQSSSADPEDASKRVKIEHVRIIYQCTWPGCRVKTDVCVDIERHVRSKHLGRREPVTEDDIDHEEEFYYTEVEVPLSASLSDLATPPSPSSPIITNPTPITNSQQNMSYQIVNTPMQVSSLISTNGPPTSTVSLLPPSFPKTNSIISGLPVLSDHMDMARPPHENPEYVHQVQQQNVVPPNSRPLITNPPQVQQQQPMAPRRLIASASAAVNTGHGTIIIPQSPIQQPQQQMPQQPLFQTVRQPIAAAQTNALPIAMPVTSFPFTATNATNQTMSAISTNAHHGKYIRLSPKPYNAVPQTGSLGRNNPSSPSNSLNSQNVKSPIRRPRGDAKKCRKVYGMDHRDLWCTQCKWKKACTRFGESN